MASFVSRCTVPIAAEARGNANVVGTGTFFDFGEGPCLITASHVLDDHDYGIEHLTIPERWSGTRMYPLGTVQIRRERTDEDKAERNSWLLIACQEGFDCSPNADWVKNACYLDPQCAYAVSPTELVEHFAGDDWPKVQQRAKELKAKLDAGQWDDLGLGVKD